jgi:DMSO/TMAO reductase YedYZ molybdopterin-dependent catalytic subunit
MSELSTRPTIIPGKPVRWFPLRPHQLIDDITPVSQVFILAPLGVPAVDRDAWRLEIVGLIEHTATLSFDDILAFPRQELRAFHECAGNPQKPTLATRRINNVVWGGVPLAQVFSRYGIKIRQQASFLWAGGLDNGVYGDAPVDSYVKDLPLDEALTHAFLAYELNGAPLLPEHGYPLRLVMPGYYGTNSVKWLRRLEVAGTRADSLFTTKLYNDPVPPDDPLFAQGGRPVWRVAPESVIVSPAPGETVAGTIDIWGWAWAHAGIRDVEVSVDGGASWQTAVVDKPTERSWQKFRYSWRPEKAGPVVLMSRAIDQAGDTQPRNGARNCIYTVGVIVSVET